MTEQQATPPRPGPQRPPSPPWYGAVVMGLLLVTPCWLLLYAFADLAWQQRLGGWNYLIALLVSVVPSQMLEHWRGDVQRFDGRPARRRRKRAAKQAAREESA